MHWIDWSILVGFIAWIVYDGLKRTRDSHELEGYFLANRTIPWWAAGLSVMATQLSAITMIGTTGQGYNDGMRFIQFYLRAAARDGHPVASRWCRSSTTPASTRRTSTSSAASTRRRAASPACCS